MLARTSWLLLGTAAADTTADAQVSLWKMVREPVNYPVVISPGSIWLKLPVGSSSEWGAIIHTLDGDTTFQ